MDKYKVKTLKNGTAYWYLDRRILKYRNVKGNGSKRGLVWVDF